MTTPNSPELRTGRLLLRPFAESDLEHVYRGLSDPDVNRYYGVSYRTMEETKAQMKFFADLEKDGTGIWWAICTADNGAFYGAGGLNSLIREHRKAEIGCWLHKAHWGQGIMAESLQVICHYGFNTMDLHRIEGLVETENMNCKNAMKKLHFEHEGTMKDCEIKNGKFISLDIYAKINTK